jgi:signal transduction histidine kinase
MLIFGIVNFYLSETHGSATIFFTAAAFCLTALWLNRQGYYFPSASIAAISVVLAAHINLLDGAGIRDPGVVAYPMIIIIGGLLFGKRIIPLFAVISIGSLVGVVYIGASFSADIDRLLIISVLLLVAAATTWAIMTNMDRNIAHIILSETNLRRAYEQTQEQARQVQRIIETVPEGVLLLDADQLVILTNQTAQKFLELLAPSYHEHIPLRQLGNLSVEKILGAAGDESWLEITINDPELIFEVTARSVQQTSPSLQDWVLVLRDVTLERKQQKSLQEQERLATVGHLAAGIAHDFRNILSVISTYSQIVRARPDTPKRYEYLTVIQEQAQDAAHLIEQILDFSRRSVIELKATDMVELVIGLVTLLKRTIPSNIVIRFEYEPGRYILKADKTRLQQALTNLAINARDAMPNGGNLHFSLSSQQPTEEQTLPLVPAPDAWLCLRVSDTGSGIETADLPHIFEPFYTKKEPGKGTGLGLAQVYGIVKQHGGEITVESTPGEGCSFYLFLPAIAEEPASPINLEGKSFVFAQSLTILLVGRGFSRGGAVLQPAARGL